MASSMPSASVSGQRSTSTASPAMWSASSRTRATSATTSRCCPRRPSRNQRTWRCSSTRAKDRVDDFRPPGDTGRILSSRGDLPEDVLAAVLILVVSTLVLTLVGLVAASSFTVIAQRRLPQLGMMSAVGATEKHLRLTMLATGAVTGVVAAVVGTVLGLAGWIALAPSVSNAVGHRMDALNIPWWLVLAAMLLAVVAATAAAWWPGRTMSRIPTVLALSGRPPERPALHRSSLLAIGCLVGGAVCLAVGSKTGAASAIDLTLIAVGHARGDRRRAPGEPPRHPSARAARCSRPRRRPPSPSRPQSLPIAIGRSPRRDRARSRHRGGDRRDGCSGREQRGLRQPVVDPAPGVQRGQVRSRHRRRGDPRPAPGRSG